MSTLDGHKILLGNSSLLFFFFTFVLENVLPFSVFWHTTLNTLNKKFTTQNAMRLLKNIFQRSKKLQKSHKRKKKEEPTWTNYINRSVCTYIFIGRKCLRQFGVEWMWKQFLSFSFILCSTRNLSNQIKCIENANSAPLPRDAHHSHAVAWRLLYCQRSMNFIRHKLSHRCVQVQIPESFQWNSTR